jgi:hypothetical protein
MENFFERIEDLNSSEPVLIKELPNEIAPGTKKGEGEPGTKTRTRRPLFKRRPRSLGKNGNGNGKK